MKPEFITISNIFIDDIVLPNGATRMGTVGGAGTHALVGMGVWSDKTGIVASVGDDFSPDFGAKLSSLGADLSGVLTRKGCRTTRAWQIFEYDDTRTEIMRVDYVDYPKWAPEYEEIPNEYRAASGFHIHLNVSFVDLQRLFTSIRKNQPNAVILWEPTQPQAAKAGEDFLNTLQMVDVFSPNLNEARAITGFDDRRRAAEFLSRCKVKIVAIRAGSAGSLVLDEAGQFWQIPVIPGKVVDVTGAGNAYCGGFLVARTRGQPASIAGLHGAVSASFAIQQFGVPRLGKAITTRAQHRLELASHLLQRL